MPGVSRALHAITLCITLLTANLFNLIILILHILLDCLLNMNIEQHLIQPVLLFSMFLTLTAFSE